MTDTTTEAEAKATTSTSGNGSKSGSLTALRLPELQAMASRMGIKGTGKMRKNDLIAAIKDNGGSSPARGHGKDGSQSTNVQTTEAESEKPDVTDGQRSASAGGTNTAAVQSSGSGENHDDRGDNRGGKKQEARDDRNNRGVEKHDNRDKRGDDKHDGRDNRGGDKQDNRDNRGDNNSGKKQEDRQDDRDNRGGDNRDNRGNDNRNNRNRRGRSRTRDRKRRGSSGGRDNYQEPEIRDDDVLLPVAGILDVHDNYAFVRTSGYLPGANDVYVSMGQVKKNNLRKGDAIVGAVRQPREGENNNKKFNALVRLDSVNGLSIDDSKRRVAFGKLTPLYPQERLRLETDAKQLSARIIDLVAPIGKGQRGLIVAPPKAGKTLILQAIANAIAKNNPEVHLMVVLVDERPEEVTDMQRTVNGEVIASTFDRPADDHTTVAELAIERAKRLVEMGSDVVVLLDSITRLGRAYNMAQPASGRILSGGVDANALYPPKKFFGAARNIENGGSLTILATALVETGSKGDEVIFEEFKGTGNSELRLSRQLADKRIFPAVDVNASGTRREENLLTRDETQVMWKLRRILSGLEQQQAVELLLGKLKDTETNIEFLMQVQKTTPLPKSAADD